MDEMTQTLSKLVNLKILTIQLSNAKFNSFKNPWIGLKSLEFLEDLKIYLEFFEYNLLF